MDIFPENFVFASKIKTDVIHKKFESQNLSSTDWLLFLIKLDVSSNYESVLKGRVTKELLLMRRIIRNI